MTAPSGRDYWFHRHPRWGLSVFTLLGCVAAILLAEVASRLVLPQWAPIREERVKFWAYDPVLGWAHRPNQRGRFTHPDFSVEVVINSQGMRGREYSAQRTGKRRMLVLGDSFGWGFGVEQDQRFSEILGRAHPDWEIINASVSGYGTDQEYLLLKDRGLKLEPDVVLLLFCGNDFEENLHGERYWHFKPYFVIDGGELSLRNVPVPRATVKQRLERFFLGRTYLGPRIYFAWVHAGRMLRRLSTPPPAMLDQELADSERARSVTRGLITKMNELCATHGCRFLVASTALDSLQASMLQEIVGGQGIPYLPLDPFFEHPTTKLTFAHDGHWNARGHEVAANALDAFLRKIGVFGG